MKKKLIFLTTLSLLLSASVFTSNAAGATSSLSSVSDFFSSFLKCTPAIVILIISVILIVFAVIFRKKLSNRLDDSTASQMTNAFIAFFSIFGIACYIMAVVTDGETWKNMLNGTDNPFDDYTHFSDYLQTLQNAGSQHFYKSAESFSPFSLMLFFFFAQFMPSDLIHSDSYSKYVSLLKNQTFIYFYLILILFCVVLIYKTSRSILRRNELKMRNELIAFLLVVSYPTMYCISMGNITGFAIALCLFFIEFKDHENKILRELSIIAIAVSGAIVPYTFVFAFLLLKDKSKMSKLNFAQSVVFFVALFIIPSALTGTGNMVTYVKSLLFVGENFVPGNGSLANMLKITGINNIFIYLITAITEVAAFLCIFILPATWQKTAAAVYCILNLLPNVNSLTMLFVFIPLVYLLSQKTHKAVDWLYLLAFALLVTPFPEWFYSHANELNLMLEAIGIIGIRNANEIIAPIATQMIFVLIICQAVSVLKQKKKEKAIEQKVV